MPHQVEPRVLGTTTTSGTGNITLAASALTGHRTIQSVCAVGDTFWGYIEAVDSNGNATGDYEEGLYTYSAADTVARTKVSRSSNANALVALAAATTKRVGITALCNEVKAVTLSANANDYEPADLIRAGRVDITPSATAVITGLLATYDGHTILLRNTSAKTSGFAILLLPESASSAAANRFALPISEPMWMLPGDAVELIYSTVDARWNIGVRSSGVFPDHNSSYSLAEGRLAAWAPADGAATMTAQGCAITATGTLTAAAKAITNAQTQSSKVEALVTTASTTAVAGARSAQVMCVRGNASGVGGFMLRTRWGPATGVATGTRRAFAGLIAGTGAPTDVQPSSLLNLIGMGYDAADGNMQIFHNDGSGTATKVNLGFARPGTDRTSFYELNLYSAPNGSVVHYLVVDLTNGNCYVGVLSTDLPANTQYLCPHVYVSVGGTSSVVGVALGDGRLYMLT